MGVSSAEDSQAGPASPAQQRFSELVQHHAGMIHGIARAYCWHGQDREELEQEIVLHLWRAFPTYDPERTFSTWLYRIALNVAISYVRVHTRRERHFTALPPDLEPTDSRAVIPGEQDERIEVLGQFIETLDPLNRAVLLLYLEEHSSTEIAEVLGISQSNVTTKLSRLKQRVRAYSAPARSQGPRQEDTDGTR